MKAKMINYNMQQMIQWMMPCTVGQTDKKCANEIPECKNRKTQRRTTTQACCDCCCSSYCCCCCCYSNWERIIAWYIDCLLTLSQERKRHTKWDCKMQKGSCMRAMAVRADKEGKGRGDVDEGGGGTQQGVRQGNNGKIFQFIVN